MGEGEGAISFFEGLNVGANTFLEVSNVEARTFWKFKCGGKNFFGL